MGTQRWTFEDLAVGTNVNTTTNAPHSDIGMGPLTASAGTLGSLTIVNSWSFPGGGKALRLRNTSSTATPTAGGPNQIRFPMDTPSATFALDYTFHLEAEVTGTAGEQRYFLRGRHSSGYIFSLLRKQDGKLSVQGATGTLASGAVAMPLSWRVEVTGTLASGANSNITIKVYDTASTPNLIDTVTLTNVDLNAAAYVLDNVEIFNSGTVGLDLIVDAPGNRAGSTTPMGPLVVTGPPVIVSVEGSNYAIIDVTDSTASNPWTASITQLAGASVTPTELVEGYWIVPMGDASSTWRVTVTDPVSALSATKDFTVPAKAVAGPAASVPLVLTATGWR